MVRMRTIKQTVKYFKESDSSTAITEWWLRVQIKNRAFPFHKAGKKVLINLDTLEEYLKTAAPLNSDMEEEIFTKIRKVNAI